ncbi:MAG TPA: hypothetical protein DEB07_03335, partial [Candidatus Moranbacteria bacterium]|nr:hypothetical protein [Candidatus Moranbacteria bacterium]
MLEKKGGFALAELFMDAANEDLLRRLEKEKIIESFTIKWLLEQIAGGYLPIICSDGSIDARQFYRRADPAACFIQLFGGPVIFSSSYRDYNEEGVRFLFQNMEKSRKFAGIDTTAPHYHWPCKDLIALSYVMEDIFSFLGKSSSEALHSAGWKTLNFFHAKLFRNGGE